MSRKYSVAVVGATGIVGQELIKTFEARRFPIAKWLPFASERSIGRQLKCMDLVSECRVLEKGCFEGVDLVFLDASDEISRQWVPHAAESGAWVIDKSAAFRMDSEVLLVVPEVNGELLEARAAQARKAGGKLGYKSRILASPNCSTTGLILPLKVLHDHWGLKRVVASTYQSVSGAGAQAVAELDEQVRTYQERGQIIPKNYSHQIAFNCIPQIGSFKEGAYTSEELKLVQESRKILNLPKLPFTATAVRVPTFRGHGESVNVELQKDFDLSAVRKNLSEMPGIEVLDDPARQCYPMNEVEADCAFRGAAYRDPVCVGRLRRDDSVPFGVNLWLVSDNLRKGAALNAVQIAERLIRHL